MKTTKSDLFNHRWRAEFMTEELVLAARYLLLEDRSGYFASIYRPNLWNVLYRSRDAARAWWTYSALKVAASPEQRRQARAAIRRSHEKVSFWRTLAYRARYSYVPLSVYH